MALRKTHITPFDGSFSAPRIPNCLYLISLAWLTRSTELMLLHLSVDRSWSSMTFNRKITHGVTAATDMLINENTPLVFHKIVFDRFHALSDIYTD